MFSRAHGMLFRIDHKLGHTKKSLNKFKRTEITSSIFSGHNGMKLEISHRKKNGKRMNTWRQNSILLESNGSMMKSKKKSENISTQMKMKTQPYKTYGMQQKQF